MRELLGALDRFLEAARKVSRRRALAPIERKLEGQARAFFTAQGKALRRQLEAAQASYPVREGAGGDALAAWLDRLFEQAVAETSGELATAIEAAAKAALLSGGRACVAELKTGISFDLKNPRATAYVERVGADKVSKVDQATRQVLHELAGQAVDEGWSYNRTAKAIIERYGEFAEGKPQAHIPSRAHLVAVTEAGEAYETGNFIPVQDLADTGVEMEKCWSTMRDGRVSAGCRANEALGYVPLDHVYVGTGWGWRVLHPLRFPGCRCVELYRRKRTIGEATKRRGEGSMNQPRDEKGRFASGGAQGKGRE